MKYIRYFNQIVQSYRYDAGVYTNKPYNVNGNWNLTSPQIANSSNAKVTQNDELNKLSCEWDMSLSKSILKNRIDLKLQAIDILRQYKSVAYFVNERGIRETHTVSLPSYLLFSVTYKFNKQPKKKSASK